MSDLFHDDRVRLRARYDLCTDRTDFLLEIKRESERLVVKPVVFESIGLGLIDGPTFSLPQELATDFLRSVMDVAWEMGVRPTGYDNDLGATKAHLRDMRALAFRAAKMEPPK